MTSLYIDRRGADIELEGDTLVVRVDGEREGTAPLRTLERVVLKGTRHIAARAITRLAERGIGLVILPGRSGDPAASLTGSDGDARLRVAQYALAADEAERTRLATDIVRTKIAGQARVLNADARTSPRLKDAIERLDKASERLRTGSAPTRSKLRGIEGAASAAYFSGFTTLFPASLGFSGHNRRPPRDPVNVCLSLGYTMMHHEAVRQITCAGLDPMVGVYHDPVPGRESLACDLAEGTRPLVDAWVLSLFRDRTLEGSHFTQAGAACRLGKAGRRAIYHAFEDAAPAMRAALNQTVRQLIGILTEEGPLALTLSDAEDAVEVS